MQTYEIPRDYRGEGRILYIFSTKGLIYTAVGVAFGLIFYFIFKLVKLTIVGIVIALIFGLIGFCIGTFKMPDSKKFSLTEKTGGEKIDDVIMRYIRFKQKKNRIYVSIKEEPKDE